MEWVVTRIRELIWLSFNFLQKGRGLLLPARNRRRSKQTDVGSASLSELKRSVEAPKTGLVYALVRPLVVQLNFVASDFALPSGFAGPVALRDLHDGEGGEVDQVQKKNQRDYEPPDRLYVVTGNVEERKEEEVSNEEEESIPHVEILVHSRGEGFNYEQVDDLEKAEGDAEEESNCMIIFKADHGTDEGEATEEEPTEELDSHEATRGAEIWVDLPISLGIRIRFIGEHLHRLSRNSKEGEDQDHQEGQDESWEPVRDKIGCVLKRPL